MARLPRHIEAVAVDERGHPLWSTQLKIAVRKQNHE